MHSLLVFFLSGVAWVPIGVMIGVIITTDELDNLLDK